MTDSTVLSLADELEGRVKELEAVQSQMEQEREQMKGDMAAVTDERNKYSQIVADLEAQTVSCTVAKYISIVLVQVCWLDAH